MQKEPTNAAWTRAAFFWPLFVFVLVSCQDELKTCTRHGKEGNLEFIVPCDNQGRYQGEYLEYHKSGKLWKRSWYVDGLEEDTTRLYFYKTGKVLREVPMKAGKEHGLRRTFREDGTLEEAVTFEEGLKQGAFTRFHANGVPAEVLTYEQNEATGPYFLISQDSVVIVSGEFYRGAKFGKWSHHDYDGTLLAIFSYYNGQKQGGFTVFQPDGMPYLSGDFARDLLHGQLNYYDEEGSIVRSESWVKGDPAKPSTAKGLVDGKAILPLPDSRRVYIMQDTVWIQ